MRNCDNRLVKRRGKGSETEFVLNVLFAQPDILRILRIYFFSYAFDEINRHCYNFHKFSFNVDNGMMDGS